MNEQIKNKRTFDPLLADIDPISFPAPETVETCREQSPLYQGGSCDFTCHFCGSRHLLHTGSCYTCLFCGSSQGCG